MSAILYELLDNAGLVRDGQPDAGVIRSLSVSRLIELAEQAQEVTTIRDDEDSVGVASHIASLSMGGERSPCSDLRCRTRHAQQLSQFAALYSDRVYVRNLLSRYIPHPNESFGGGDLLPDRLSSDLIDDLRVLGEWRSLVEADHLSIVSTPQNRCIHCLARISFGDEADRRLDLELTRLRELYIEQTAVALTRGPYGYSIKYTGPELLIEHGESFRAGKRPKAMNTLSADQLAVIDGGGSVTLPSDTVRSEGLIEPFITDLISSLKFELAVSNVLRASFVTDMPLQVQSLNAITANTEVERRNMAIQEHLSALLPFVGDVSTHDLLKLREREQDAFIVFRAALGKAVKEVHSRTGTFTETDANELYQDVIRPKLADLSRRVKTGKRDLVNSAKNTATTWTATLSIGMYSGLVPHNILAVASAIGLTKICADLSATLLKSRDTESVIRNDEMYFLWKVNQMTTRGVCLKEARSGSHRQPGRVKPREILPMAQHVEAYFAGSGQGRLRAAGLNKA